jgi:hypothetical protein
MAVRAGAQVIRLSFVLYDIGRCWMVVGKPVRRRKEGLDLRDRKCSVAAWKMQQYAILGPRASRPRAIVRLGLGRARRCGRIWSGRSKTIGPSHRILRVILSENNRRRADPNDRAHKDQSFSNSPDLCARVHHLGPDRVRRRAEKSLYVESKIVSTRLDLDALQIGIWVDTHLRSLAKRSLGPPPTYQDFGRRIFPSSFCNNPLSPVREPSGKSVNSTPIPLPVMERRTTACPRIAPPGMSNCT